jgi:hypothetical protein
LKAVPTLSFAEKHTIFGKAAKKENGLKADFSDKSVLVAGAGLEPTFFFEEYEPYINDEFSWIE